MNIPRLPNNILCIAGTNGGLGRRAVEMAAESPSIRRQFRAIFALARDKPAATWKNKTGMPIFCHTMRPQDESSIGRFLVSMKEEIQGMLGQDPQKISIGFVSGVTDDLAEMVQVNAIAPSRFAQMTRKFFNTSHINFHYTSSILAAERANYGDLVSMGYMQTKIDGWNKIQDFALNDRNTSASVYYFGGIADTSALLRVPTIGRMWNTTLRMRHRYPEFWKTFEPHIRLRDSSFNGSTVDCLADFLDRRNILPSERLLKAMFIARNADLDLNGISDSLAKNAALKRRERLFNGLASAIRGDEQVQRAVCSVLVESDALLQRNMAAKALIQGISEDLVGERKIYSNRFSIRPEESVAYSILKGMGEFSSGIALLCIGIDLYTCFFPSQAGESET